MKNIFFFLAILFSVSVQSQKIKGYFDFKLDNGLTVYLWEDYNQPDVSGRIVVRAGSIDEPAEYTGLAHYLEHMLFKGTRKIGALNWEKERPLYEQIVKLYDELAQTTDPAQRDTLTKRINRISLESAQFAITSDFSNLIEGMGGKGLNAATSYDYTYYLNNFPSFQIEKWLDIYSERLINPVFRSFQAELENVFEEYNMYQDNRNSHVSNFLFSNIYAGHPYERDVIGSPVHLKNPRLSKLINFYNTWYVPNNMALILVGSFDSEKVIPLIKEKFGRLQSKQLPERGSYTSTSFVGNPKFTAKIAYSPQLYIAYKGVNKGHKDELLLDFCTQLLSNSMRTGLLDKLTLDGNIGSAQAMNDTRRDDGRLLIFAAPYYDISQRMYESDRATEKLIMTEVDKLKNGQVEDWRFNSVLNEMLRQYDLVMETPSAKVNVITELYAYGLPNSEFFGLNEKLKAITKSEIQRVAKEYLSGDRMIVSIEEGKPKKDKIKKPEIKPIEQPKNQKTQYAQYLQQMPVVNVAEVFNSMDDVITSKIYEGVNLYSVKNNQNNIFSLTIRFGVGTVKMPKLEYAVPLMNSAGIMPSIDAQTLRKEYSELNVRCNYSVDKNYFYISLSGDEKNIAEACKLATRQLLMPKLDDKQLQRVKASVLMERLNVEKSDVESLSDAALNYILYKDSSDYINRLGLSTVYFSKISELTGEIIRATDYLAEVHYCGSISAGDLIDIIRTNLPLKEQFKHSNSPIIQPTVSYAKSGVYFLSNTDAQQAKVYFYVHGSQYKIEEKVSYDAFYQYFSGGFNGLVMNEIRENNSMAYTAYGTLVTPPLQNKDAYFLGYVGTQPDKVAGAIDLYMKLLTNMPLYPERVENIKTYLKQTYLSNKPSFRTKSLIYNSWKQLGYNDDPAKINMSKVQNLNFEQIVDFYNKEIKGKPVTILIVGDPKSIDLKSIEKYGKVTKLSESTLFSKIDL